MEWLKEYSPSMDENEKMFSDFGSLRNHLQIPKENFLFLHPNDSIPALRSACFVQWLIENIDFQNINIVMWVASEMTYTTEGGPWTRTIYQDNEEKTLEAVRLISQHLNIPNENVLFLVPGDEFFKEKIGEFVSNLLAKFVWPTHTAIVWFKCQDKNPFRLFKRMLL